MVMDNNESTVSANGIGLVRDWGNYRVFGEELWILAVRGSLKAFYDRGLRCLQPDRNRGIANTGGTAHDTRSFVNTAPRRFGAVGKEVDEV
jgi:hypothetical protein